VQGAAPPSPQPAAQPDAAAAVSPSGAAVPLRLQGPIFLVALGHGATHWLLGTFLILIPFVTRDLGLSYTQAGFLVTVLHISSFFFNFGGGMAVDLSGRRVVFLVACLVLGGGSMLGFGMSSNYGTLALMVAFIACANSFWHAPAISYISLRYPSRRGYALSIHSTGASLGDMIAPGMAGVLLTWLTWHQAAMVASLPALLFAVPIFLLLLPGDAADGRGKPRGMSLGAYFAGMKQMLRRPAILGLCLMVAFRGMGQTGLTLFLPLYLADVLRLSPALMGGAILGMHLGAVVMTPIAGAASDRIGRRPVVMVGLLATTVIIVGLTLVNHTALFVGGVFLLGFALYSIRAVMQSWMIDLSPPEMSGTATSIFFATQSAFSAAMPLIGGMVADSFGLFEVFYLIAGTMMLANAMIFIVPRGPQPPAARPG